MTDQADREALEAATTSSPPTEAPAVAASPVDVPSTDDAPADAAAPADAENAEAGSEAPSEAGDDADGGDGDGAEAAEGEGASGEEGGKKKRRRRRKKKKPGEGEPGEASAPEPSFEPDRRPNPHPFHHFFDSSLRRHLFAVGETIAGVVTRVADDVAIVDVFGKATAFARLHEPREIPAYEIPLDDSSAGGLNAPDEDDAHLDGDAPVSEPPVEVHAEPSAETTEAAASAEPSVEPASEPAADPSAEPAATEPAADALPAEVSHSDAVPESARRVQARPEPPPPPPTYVLEPEGVPAIEEGTVFRGRIAAIAESGHIAIVNELVDRKATRRWLAHARDARERVPGLVFGYNRGGFDVLLVGVRAFCPVNGMSLDSVDDPATSLGAWHEFHVQTVKGGSQGLVVSRRSILEREARRNARAFLKGLAPGQRLKGRVTQVRDFGVFVDIGYGAEGLVHQSELSFDRGVRPSDVAKPGDVIEVQVLRVQGADRKKKERVDRVSLSVKSLLPDPFEAAVDGLTEGVPRKGTVVRTAEFGAFIQLAPGIDGLLHITELGKDLKHAKEAVNEGDELFVVIERIDRKARRISLSKLTAAEAALFEKGELDPSARAPRVKQGGTLKVIVTQVGAAGLSVRIDNVIGKKGRGFIPNSEMGTPRGTDHRKKWPPGTEIDVTIIGTDRDGGMRCSLKRFLQDEERRAVKEYRKEAAKQGLGTFGDILRSKLGIDQG